MKSLSLNIRLDPGKDVRVKMRYSEGELFGSATAMDGNPLTIQEIDEARDKLDKLLREMRFKVPQ
jgi:hypothetical protein